MKEKRDKKCSRCKCYRYPKDFIKEGRDMKTCIYCRENAAKYRIEKKCEHKKRKSRCRECNGSQTCEHSNDKHDCKICSNPIKITIRQWKKHCRESDKKYNRYDADRFIDRCFLQGLIEDHPVCFYEDCRVKLQYIDYKNDLATIERLDNSIGHIKSNCVICCMKCNKMKKSNRLKQSQADLECY